MARLRRGSRAHRHPANVAQYDEATLGERVADRATSFFGSWVYIAGQTVIVALWIAANVWLLSRPFDPYPFILLNLAFSTQAAYAAPLILLASNRQSKRDRITLEHAAAEADIADRQNSELLSGNQQLLEHVQRLEERTLMLETRILAALGEERSPPLDQG